MCAIKKSLTICLWQIFLVMKVNFHYFLVSFMYLIKKKKKKNTFNWSFSFVNLLLLPKLFDAEIWRKHLYLFFHLQARMWANFITYAILLPQVTLWPSRHLKIPRTQRRCRKWKRKERKHHYKKIYGWWQEERFKMRAGN